MLEGQDRDSVPMHPYGSNSHCVLHVDVDSFFCQVEVLRNSGLAGIPMAIQQHQDVIAVNYPAKKAGVKKHMVPAQARAILSAAGGRLVHVFTEPDGRVSYRPYREASAALMRLLSSGLPPAVRAAVLVVEKASIDEGYLKVALHQTDAAQAQAVSLADMPSWVATSSALSWDYSSATAVAGTIRSTVKQQLGLTVSVGVAPNKLLAKLASRKAKPDGVYVVDAVATVQQLLTETPVEGLPGLGGAVAAALAKLGISRVVQLQPHSADALAALLGGQQQSRLAARLVEYGWGMDDAPVVNKGPAKSIQVQMTLTPQARPLPPNLVASGRGPVAGQAAAAAATGKLMPLLTGAADTLPRLAAVLGAMTGDLLGRVLLDRHSEDRWPRKLSVTLTTSSQPARTATRSTAFPTPALIKDTNASASNILGASTTAAQPGVPAAAAGRGEGGAAAAAAAAAFAVPGVVSEKRFAVGSALHDAVLAAAANLAQALVSPLPPNHPVTILNLSVSNFVAYEVAAASGDISRFTAASAAKAPATAPAAAADAGLQAATATSTAKALPVAAAAPAAVLTDFPQTEAAATVQLQQQQQQQHVELPAPVLPAAIATGSLQRPAKRKHLETVQEILPPAAAAAPAPAAAAPAPAAAAAAVATAPRVAQRPLTQVSLSGVSKPPVLLSDMLLHLASSSTTAEAAEEQLKHLIAAAGKAQLIQAQLQQE